MNDTSNEIRIKSVTQPFPGSLLVIPNDGKPHPGLVTLHGSEGGGYPYWKVSALRWAAEGYAVLAFCYFGARDGFVGPRQTLADMEVMDLVKALEWLKSSEYVQNKNIALDGTSRGGELALLTGSLLGDASNVDLAAISVHAPASRIWGPWNHDWIDDRCWLGETPSYEELKQHPEKFTWNRKCGPDPRNLPEHLKYSWKFKGTPLTEGSRIQVEKIRCPVFISQGLQDSVWPAEQAQEVKTQLDSHGIPCEAAFYENEGHGLAAEARFDRDNRAMRFYRKHLGV